MRSAVLGAAGADLTRDHFLTLAEPNRNRHGRSIERLCAEIATRVGLLRHDNRAQFTAFNSIAAYVYPHAAVEPGVTCSMWCNWLFFFDDAHDEDPVLGKDPGRVRAQMEHYLGLLSGAVVVASPDPLERLTLEFRARALDFAGEAWIARFCRSVSDYFYLGVLPAVENWRASRTPPLAEYVTQREHDSAVLTTIDLIEIAHGLALPDDVRNSPTMTAARLACARTVGFFNDIASYPKEIIRHRNPNNLVHVLMRERAIPIRAALYEAAEMANDAACELHSAERSITAQLPEGPHPVRTYLSAMRAWQRGNIDYSLESERYASRWSPLAELLRPDSTT